MPGISLFIISDLPCSHFPIFENYFHIRKIERFENSLVQCKSIVDSYFLTCCFRGVCDFVCSFRMRQIINVP